MKINSVEVLITKITHRKTKDGVEYISLSFLDLSSGDNFNVVSKDMEMIKIKPMTRYEMDLDLTDSKYGLKLEIDKIGQELGSI